MKKILALALIALIAVTAVFAAENEESRYDLSPRGAKIMYEVTGLFDPAYTLTTESEMAAFVVDAGSNQDEMAAGTVVFTIVDMSNFNDAEEKHLDIEFTVNNFVLQTPAGGDVAEPTGEQVNAITTKSLVVDENADSEGKTVSSVNGLKLTIDYKGGAIVNRKDTNKNVAALTLSWAKKRLQAGQYIATIVIAPTAR